MGNNNDKKLSLEEAREKYRIEREKRLRADGIRQYKELKGDYEEFDRDPYVEPGFTREAVIEDVDVVIVGGGFGGMIEAANLTKAGITNFRIIEKAGDFGGTWYWNRYPNAACDVESYVYLPLLEDTGYMPTEKYAKAPEIFAYCQLLGRTFDLYRGALFQTEVEDMRWDESRKRWNVMTSRSDVLSAKFIVIAGGVLHKAKLPGIPGIETYAGRAFHTSRWDYSYTGGSSQTLMEKLADKRVGIIGTGATAVQVVPKLAEAAKELFVFQRTAACVGVRNNKPTDPEWFKSLKPGWQAERTRNFTQAVTGAQPAVDMIDDEWTKMNWVDTRKLPENDEEALELERIDFENMERVRQRIADVIKDPATAELMMPWYSQSCKRPCFHDEYLPAFNRSNVHLVDTDGKGVNEINESGVIVNGVEYPVDLLIFASGFEVTTGYTHRLGFDPKGRDGVSLSEAWAEGPATLHGVLSNGFPNMFMISTVQGAQATNFVHSITEAAQHVAFLIEQCVKGDIATIEPETAAQENWFETLFAQLWGIARYNATCTPGYLNSEGGGDMRSARAIAWMTSVLGFAEYVENWRQQGDLAGLTLTPNS
ncbi:MAG: NAD(P)/FAD-dependent oxidoreductase [Ilumatobacteraceae bacterium]|nr:NAD(P)/FAD-dependent oxidoreductase [Ilumatobacteraceae bacterium]MDP4706527.1 NAD(P)/FAD-dependent oxidoreductase [Ilumatobacteraceae bacterium]MDP4713052.1 NAD(P)/FAD-dependent oxidoreductase [Ilumatobacteraceae bacterium]MDP4936916.1 NAD(P)/FAD-dependent oxidoreductase [Ilumatobacteraceae bacterium]MDP5115071.1 NAD(P)/FAD-dependent oxidoreductase [Ilumatobacteraceae bacterium]